MSVQKNGLKEEYRTVLSVSGGEKIFQRKCISFLEDQDAKTCFEEVSLHNIVKEFLEKAEKEEKVVTFNNLEDVLKCLEIYARNLLVKPWCKEYFSIKVYNGFFKYKIERWIPFKTVFNILNSFGYNEEKQGTGVFTLKELDEIRVLLVGFELYLAYTQLYAFRSSGCLDNYSMADITQARYHTTGKSTKMLEWLQKNCSLKMQKKQDLVVSHYDISYDLSRREAITTAVFAEHYDKNGQVVEETIRQPPLYESEMAEEMLSSLSSLQSANISDKQLYGDETDVPAEHPENHSLFLNSYTGNLFKTEVDSINYRRSYPAIERLARGPPVSYQQRMDEYNSRGLHSLPYPTVTPSNDQRGHLDKKTHDDLLPKKYHTQYSQNGESKLRFPYELQSLGNKGLGSGCQVGQRESISSKILTNYQNSCPVDFLTQSDGKHLPVRQHNHSDHETFPHASLHGENSTAELLMPQPTNSLDRDKKRVDEIFSNRIPQDAEDNASGINKNTKMFRKQCYFCDKSAVIVCLVCNKGVCKCCLPSYDSTSCTSAKKHHNYCIEKRLSKEIQCGKNYYCPIGKQEQIADADVDKWQCERCTCRNSLKQRICFMCSCTRDATEDSHNVYGWECAKCTFVNEELEKWCKQCQGEKEDCYRSTMV